MLMPTKFRQPISGTKRGVRCATNTGDATVSRSEVIIEKNLFFFFFPQMVA